MNADTMGVIKRIQADQSLKDGADLGPSEGFWALLATDNGKGLARMLGTYPEYFGRKTIVKVRIWSQQLCWFLEELEVSEPSVVTPSGRTTLSRKERPKEKKMASRASDSPAV